MGIVAQEVFGFGNVSASERNIAWLFRKNVDDGLFTEGSFDMLDKFAQRGGVTFPNIKDVARRGVVRKRGDDALEDIFDVGVIASG